MRNGTNKDYIVKDNPPLHKPGKLIVVDRLNVLRERWIR